MSKEEKTSNVAKTVKPMSKTIHQALLNEVSDPKADRKALEEFITNATYLRMQLESSISFARMSLDGSTNSGVPEEPCIVEPFSQSKLTQIYATIHAMTESDLNDLDYNCRLLKSQVSAVIDYINSEINGGPTQSVNTPTVTISSDDCDCECDDMLDNFLDDDDATELECEEASVINHYDNCRIFNGPIVIGDSAVGAATILNTLLSDDTTILSEDDYE